MVKKFVFKPLTPSFVGSNPATPAKTTAIRTRAANRFCRWLAHSCVYQVKRMQILHPFLTIKCSDSFIEGKPHCNNSNFFVIRKTFGLFFYKRTEFVRRDVISVQRKNRYSVGHCPSFRIICLYGRIRKIL